MCPNSRGLNGEKHSSPLLAQDSFSHLPKQSLPWDSEVSDYSKSCRKHSVAFKRVILKWDGSWLMNH